MAIQNELPYGGTGWHGDQAVSLRSTLGEANTLVNDILTQYNALLVQLDATEGTTIAGNAAIEIAAPLVSVAGGFRLATLAHVAQGGAYAHGDNAVMLREYLSGAAAVANELLTDLPVLLAELDGAGAGSTLTDGDYVAVIGALLTAPAQSSIHSRFASGGEAAHGDQGVALRLSLEQGVVLTNQLKSVLNQLLTKIENDGGRAAAATTFDPGLLVLSPNIA